MMGSADSVSTSLYREKFPARRVPHSPTFLAVQRLRENGTFLPKSVDRCQERTPQVLEPHFRFIRLLKIL
jgi:hypothetical protein